MASLAFDRRALEDLDRISDFLVAENSRWRRSHPAAHSRGDRGSRIASLDRQGPVEGGLRELVISQGNTGYIALYHYRRAAHHVQVRAVRHQRESGFDED
jgi:plasmid stabilization system protein ParE